ncbi:hypothetical protein [Pseudoxanthomonas sp. LjRoot143]|uniref:hypothetical protein n=1 Tax=Pseudoxanthomonas sp. LjRoot143 TaxID=3342266 RepID=UPI003F4F4B03
MVRCVCIAALAVLLVGCNPERVTVSDEQQEVLALFGCPDAHGTYESATIEQVIADPARFHAKPIKVSGFYHVSFENSAIYPAPSAVMDFKRGLWLLGRSGDDLIGRRVTVRGVYDPGQNDGRHRWPIGGHLGQWPGAICVHSMEAAD